MQLVDFSINEGPVAVPWLLDSREDELDLEIHGCGCGCTDGGCGCGGSCSCSSCSDCSCSSDDEDDMSADDYDDAVSSNLDDDSNECATEILTNAAAGAYVSGSITAGLTGVNPAATLTAALLGAAGGAVDALRSDACSVDADDVAEEDTMGMS